MAKDDDASEISIEETNKLRAKLGLRPIPLLKDSTTFKPVKPSNLVPNESKSTGGDRDAGDTEISLEETNKLRLSLGLKPIVKTEKTPSSSNDIIAVSSVDQDAQARNNWLEMQAQQQAKKKKLEIKERIQKQKEKAILRQSTTATAPLVEKEESRSTLDWLKQLRQSQKAKTSGGLTASNSSSNSKDSRSKIPQYTSDDLKGLKVAHDMEDILKEGESVILTLKDTEGFGDEDEEGDVLESTDVIEKQKLKEKLNAKKGLNRLQYDDDDDSGILSKYDDVMSETKSQGFTLGNSSTIFQSTDKPHISQQNKVSASKKVVDSIDFDFSDIVNTANSTSSDYQASSSRGKPPKIKKKKLSKKPNKSKERPAFTARKRQREDDDDIPEGDDDEELQALLASNRRKVQRTMKTKKIETPQEIAEMLQEEQEDNATSDQAGGFVVNQTAEFLSVLRKTSEEEDTPSKQQESKRVSFSLTNPTKHEPTVMESITEGDQESEATQDSAEQSPKPFALASDEPTLSGGIADTLKLLRSRGFIKEKTTEQLEQEKAKAEQREWNRNMSRERIERDIELARRRERERERGTYDNLSQRERELLAQRENHDRDIKEARIAQKRFENYKPDIKLEYRDDSGRLLTRKEAYRHLSHQFHGKGPGKGKMEKQLKRQEEEKKKMSESLFTNEDDQRAGAIAGVRLQ